MKSFETLFREATTHSPYLYQVRLAESLSLPTVLNVPTGAGKTAAAFFTWLWRRRYHHVEEVRSATPCRLVYCLPMRVLVEQTRDNIAGYLSALRLDSEIGVNILMGGEDEEDWYLHPEKDAVLIGTQDMLLSRALNRGYAMSRFRWPLPFALLNNDALWVIDEVQLLGAGVSTTAQLSAFRQRFNTIGPTHTMWMSATLQPEWLKTVDHPTPGRSEVFQLKPEEQGEDRISRGLEAVKMVSNLNLKVGATTAGYPKELASNVLNLHQAGTQTIVIVNTVSRARDIYIALKNNIDKQKKGVTVPQVMLIHSRFRPQERKEKLDLLVKQVEPEGPGRIVISTQVIEAGVDISSACLVTELAPWSSLVQRFGRCNRYGEENITHINWIDLGEKAYAPYDADQMAHARSMLLEELDGRSAAPASLPADKSNLVNKHVLRRKDLNELFDTAPDLSGNDVDISRFIRDAGETNMYLCWREWQPREEPPPQIAASPNKAELCPVPIGQFRDFMKQAKVVPWVWDYSDRCWRRLSQSELFPGQILVLHAKDGGYEPETGWNPAAKGPVTTLPLPQDLPAEASGDDPYTFTSNWQTLEEHSEQTAAEMKLLTKELQKELDKNGYGAQLVEAAYWHDLGKAHPVFQETLLAGLDEDEKNTHLQKHWAKAPRAPGRSFLHSRPHFRHELASLLTLLDNPEAPKLEDLTLYLVVSHHGKVRLAIRSIPGSDGHKKNTANPAAILGIEDGDEMPAIEIEMGRSLPSSKLTLQAAELGSNDGGLSWLARALALLEKNGPFRLAYLEALLRTADIRASIKAQQEVGI